MKRKNHLSTLQIVGLIVAILGLVFVAFPAQVGSLAIRIVALIIASIGLSSLLFSLFVKSSFSTIASTLLIFAGIYAFLHPESILMLLGMSCILAGINGLFLNFSRLKTRGDRSLLMSVAVIALGIFALLNSKAALITVILIIGIITVILGIMIFLLGNTFSFSKRAIYYKRTEPAEHTSEKIVIQIDPDEAEEIDYKDM